MLQAYHIRASQVYLNAYDAAAHFSLKHTLVINRISIKINAVRNPGTGKSWMNVTSAHITS